jgi:hypothetical protein
MVLDASRLLCYLTCSKVLLYFADKGLSGLCHRQWQCLRPSVKVHLVWSSHTWAIHVLHCVL